eukprot:4030520-Amphidinium_carterae.1
MSSQSKLSGNSGSSGSDLNLCDAKGRSCNITITHQLQVQLQCQENTKRITQHFRRQVEDVSYQASYIATFTVIELTH